MSTTLLDWLHALYSDLVSFTPADFHWPTAVVTALLLVAFYCVNTIIAAAVSSLVAPSPSPASSSTSAPSASSLLDFYLLVGRLKTTKRTGWVNHAVPLPESVADHMYRMALMAFTLIPVSASLSSSPVVTALAHDLAESIVGDITPPEISGVSKQDKQRRERAAMQRIAQLLGDEHGAALQSAWEGYETETAEQAQLLHDLDKLEMIVQAFEYEREEINRRTGQQQCGPGDSGGERAAGGKEELKGGAGGSAAAAASRQQSLARFYESRAHIRDVRVLRVVDELMMRREKMMAEQS